MCIINDKTSNHNKESTLRRGLTKLSSFPAAWAISTKTNISFWSLYGAIQESEQCYVCIQCTFYNLFTNFLLITLN